MAAVLTSISWGIQASGSASSLDYDNFFVVNCDTGSCFAENVGDRPSPQGSTPGVSEPPQTIDKIPCPTHAQLGLTQAPSLLQYLLHTIARVGTVWWGQAF